MHFKQIGVLILGILGLVYFGLKNYQSTLADSHTAGYNQAKAECKQRNDKALLAAKDKTITNLQSQIDLANNTVQQLRSDKSANAQRAEKLQQEIDYVTSTWTPPGSSKPEPQPGCMFTHGFVRVYNQSFNSASSSVAGMPAIGTATRADGTAPTTASTDPSLQPSGIDRADILRHANQAGQQCQNTAAQLNRLIDHLKTLQKRNK